MNVTVNMSEELIRLAKHAAVDTGQSLSAWMASLIKKELITVNDEAEKAKKQAIKALKNAEALNIGKFDRNKIYNAKLKKWN